MARGDPTPWPFATPPARGLHRGFKRSWLAYAPVSMALVKVPEATLVFWVTKILATTLGETAGDAVSMSMNLGYLVGTAIFGVVFLCAVGVGPPRLGWCRARVRRRPRGDRRCVRPDDCLADGALLGRLRRHAAARRGRRRFSGQAGRERRAGIESLRGLRRTGRCHRID